jgi:hypothetical protein
MILILITSVMVAKITGSSPQVNTGLIEQSPTLVNLAEMILTPIATLLPFDESAILIK